MADNGPSDAPHSAVDGDTSGTEQETTERQNGQGRAFTTLRATGQEIFAALMKPDTPEDKLFRMQAAMLAVAAFALFSNIVGRLI